MIQTTLHVQGTEVVPGRPLKVVGVSKRQEERRSLTTMLSFAAAPRIPLEVDGSEAKR